MNQPARRSRKASLPPGTLVHVGRRHSQSTTISLLRYGPEGVSQTDDPGDQVLAGLAAGPGQAWLRVQGLHEIQAIGRLGDLLGLHPLVQEDIVNASQRPKLEDYGAYLYLVLKALVWDQDAGDYRGEQISLVLGRNFLVSFEESQGPLLEAVAQRLGNGKGRLRGQGADYLAYSLLDAVVDSFFAVLEELGDQVEAVEEVLLANPGKEVLRRLHLLKRRALMLRRAVWPLREVISALERQEGGLVAASTRLYLRDVYDHTIQIMDAADTNRDLLAGLLDLYLSSVSNRLNEVMKVLTVIATIFIPLTFLAGVYGMNFKHMPELEWPWGYPAVLLVMAVSAAGMLYYFRRKKWF
ncbi:MAG: magnesium/cobalt transporter CorA [Desulfarculus sp.]|nr:magnesium/cobalt transporter CorA [Desulfarculus sp.]